jgi:hypothetical protein
VPEYVIDPATGRTIHLPDTLGSYMGLQQYQPPLEGGADPTAWGNSGVEQYHEPTVPEVVMDSARFAADKQGREALPPNVRDGTYFTDDNASGAPQPPMLAQRSMPSPSGSTMGPRGRQNLTQSTGPLGTVGQIGHDSIEQLAGPQGEYATQEQLDAYNRDQATAIPAPATGAPVDPNKPEQAGADLQRQGISMQEGAVTQSAAADERAAGFEERQIAARNQELDKIRRETARQEAEKQKRFEEIKSNVTKSTDTWANYKVDPGRRWKNVSRAQKIGAAISVAMSALGDALQHKSGPNLALEIINKSIDDDVNAQIQEREHLGAGRFACAHVARRLPPGVRRLAASALGEAGRGVQAHRRRDRAPLRSGSRRQGEGQRTRDGRRSAHARRRARAGHRAPQRSAAR